MHPRPLSAAHLHLFLLLILAIPCAASDSTAAAIPPAPDALFARDLFDQLAKTPGNILVSPPVIHAGLALIAVGARGDTATEFATVLHLAPGDLATAKADDNDDPPTVITNLALWASNRAQLVPAFIDAARTRFAAHLDTIDFTNPDTKTRINAAIAAQTSGAIPTLLDAPPDPTCALLLTTVLAFQAHWKHPFRTDRTQPGDFAGPAGAISIPFMNQMGGYPYTETATAQVVELPYEGDDAMDLIVPFTPRSMVLGAELGITSPPPETPADPALALAATEAELHRVGFAPFTTFSATASATIPTATPPLIELYLPRFTIACSPDLLPPLNALGLHAACDRNHADLSGIAIGTPLWLGAIRHRATLTCEELGTTARAASAFEIPAAPAPDATITANHPFLLLIRNTHSGKILFIGRVVDPR